MFSLGARHWCDKRQRQRRFATTLAGICAGQDSWFRNSLRCFGYRNTMVCKFLELVEYIKHDVNQHCCSHTVTIKKHGFLISFHLHYPIRQLLGFWIHPGPTRKSWAADLPGDGSCPRHWRPCDIRRLEGDDRCWSLLGIAANFQSVQCGLQDSGEKVSFFC